MGFILLIVLAPLQIFYQHLFNPGSKRCVYSVFKTC